MEFSYFEPAPALRQFVSSYYFVAFAYEISDIMRAEIANARFILDGAVTTELSGEAVTFNAGAAPLCGPTYRASKIRFEAGARIFGAAITPLGWRRLFSMSAQDAADKHMPLTDAIPASRRGGVDAIFNAPDQAGVIAAADALFLSLVDNDRSVHEEFIHQATDWIVDPEPNEIHHLLDHVDISHRQVERLCKSYFGSGPKKLHRKFRALHAANRLTWQSLDDWRDVARAAYYDQAHFIREFKLFNGRTPKEFMNGPHILVRTTLEERLKINHASPFSLVG
ncbi:helix-turn-helix domain-containing protein [Hyphococcus sp.]|uniref:AraC family transcriptional regulator n=1 Tax=Hyphococcus sp. TaxID=2038636 RepID=UPI003CCC3288